MVGVTAFGRVKDWMGFDSIFLRSIEKHRPRRRRRAVKDILKSAFTVLLLVHLSLLEISRTRGKKENTDEMNRDENRKKRGGQDEQR